MIDNSIRGGQIILHKIAMFKQVLKKSFSVSLIIAALITGYYSLPQVIKLDYVAAITYIKASTAEWMYDNRIELAPSKDRKLATIDAFDKGGLYARNIRAKSIINSSYFIKEYNKVVELITIFLLRTTAITVSIIGFIFGIWYWYGSKTKEHEVTRGTKIHTAQEVSDYLNHKKIASDFIIGGMPLVKDSETTHILVTGTTGSGKSNLFNTLLPQIRNKKQPAIIVDLNGDYIANFYDPSRGDIIFNPFDARSHSWDFWKEVSSEENLNLIANALFASKSGSYDEMWNNASQQVFIDAVKVIGNSRGKTVQDLFELISKKDLKEMYETLKNTAGGSLLDPKNDKTAMSIRTNTIAFTKWLAYLKESENAFDVSSWVNSIDKGNTGWLFLNATPKQRNILQQIFTVLMDLMISSIMELGPNYDRRIWLIIDELPALNKLPSLPQALAEFRKYGGAVLSGLQSINQLSERYGHYEATTMFGQFNTKFIFRTEEQNIANMVSNLFGKVEYQESSENISYGAHEMRDGVSFGKVERTKPLIAIDDLASLANLECFVKLPDPNCRAAKIQMKYQKMKNITKSTEPLTAKPIKESLHNNNPQKAHLEMYQEEIFIECEQKSKESLIS